MNVTKYQVQVAYYLISTTIKFLVLQSSRNSLFLPHCTINPSLERTSERKYGNEEYISLHYTTMTLFIPTYINIQIEPLSANLFLLFDSVETFYPKVNWKLLNKSKASYYQLLRCSNEAIMIYYYQISYMYGILYNIVLCGLGGLEITSQNRSHTSGLLWNPRTHGSQDKKIWGTGGSPVLKAVIGATVMKN